MDFLSDNNNNNNNNNKKTVVGSHNDYNNREDFYKDPQHWLSPGPVVVGNDRNVVLYDHPQQPEKPHGHEKGGNFYLVTCLTCCKLLDSNGRCHKKCVYNGLIVLLLIGTVIGGIVIAVQITNNNGGDGTARSSSLTSNDEVGGRNAATYAPTGLSSSSTLKPIERPSSSPSLAPSMTSTKSFEIFSGADHTCAITGPFKKLYCWGLNGEGQVGDGTDTNQLSPVHIPLGFEQQVKHLSLGSHHTCAVLHNGLVKCWGDNKYGELGDNSTVSKLIPSTVLFDTKESNSSSSSNFVTQVATGYFHSCAILQQNKQLMCWGKGQFGRLGDGHEQNRHIPTPIPLGPVESVALGRKHSCAILTNSTLHCWGFNALGQVGDGTDILRRKPTYIDVGTNFHATQVALGRKHTCALLDDHITVKCWGFNSHGQLGVGTKTNQTKPALVQLPNLSSTTHPHRKIQQLKVGGWHSCILLDDGTLMCWGDNDHGQIGDGTTIDRLIPTVIDVGQGRKVIHMTLGSHHTCAALDDGELLCWGHNDFGQLGYGTTDPNIHAIHAPVIFSDTNIFQKNSN